MNHPTREEFNQFKQEVKEEVAQLAQQTEPISLKIERGLPIPEAKLLAEIMKQTGTQATDIGSIKGDISKIETRLGKIEATQEQILKLLQQRPSE
jgi:arsenate reductase-like glutaredoxin family protein